MQQVREETIAERKVSEVARCTRMCIRAGIVEFLLSGVGESLTKERNQPALPALINQRLMGEDRRERAFGPRENQDENVESGERKKRFWLPKRFPACVEVPVAWLKLADVAPFILPGVTSNRGEKNGRPSRLPGIASTELAIILLCGFCWLRRHERSSS